MGRARLARACAVTIGLAAMLALAGPAMGADFSVNSTLDRVDANPGDGTCQIVSEEPVCTLRAAVMETNALAGLDKIALPAGTYPLNLFAHDGSADSGEEAGDLDIRDNLTLTGAGMATTIIDGQADQADENEAAPERVLDLQTNTVTITGVTVQNGQWRNNGGGIRVDNPTDLTISDSVVKDNIAGEDGGGFYVHSDSTLTLRRVTVSGNDALWGGGIYNNSDGPEPDGDEADPGPGLLVEDSSIVDNVADESEGGGYGGGIYNDDEASILGSVIDGNTAEESGGGIYNDAFDESRQQVLPGELRVADSEITGNFVEDAGGGIYNDGILTMTGSLVSENEAEDEGAGIYNGGAVQVVVADAVVLDSTISGNIAVSREEQGDHGGDDGSGIWNEGLFHLERSTVSGNGAATLDGRAVRGARGGGIFNASGPVFRLPDETETRALFTIVNSTISGNVAAIGGGIYNEGAFVREEDTDLVPTVILTNVTLTGNTATSVVEFEPAAAFAQVAAEENGGGIFNAPLGGGGDGFVEAPGIVELRNTILAANSVDVPEVILLALQAGNCGGAEPVSLGRNLEGADTCGLATTAGDGDLVNADPKLGPLADNTGPTRTHALLDGSAALDAGGTSGFPATDQRGIARPQGTAADIGAYERVFVAPPPPPPPAAPPPPPPATPPPPPPPVIREPVQVAPRCRIPNVKGRTLPQARRAIVRAGCRLGNVGSRTSRTTKGIVLAQSPGPGNRVRRGFRVNVVLSKGVKAVRAAVRPPTPRFTG